MFPQSTGCVAGFCCVLQKTRQFEAEALHGCQCCLLLLHMACSIEDTKAVKEAEVPKKSFKRFRKSFSRAWVSQGSPGC